MRGSTSKLHPFVHHHDVDVGTTAAEMLDVHLTAADQTVVAEGGSATRTPAR